MAIRLHTVQQRSTQSLFPHLVLFTDKASLTREAMFYSRTSHVWDEDIPHATPRGRHQRQFAASVWAGIFSEHLIGPYLLRTRFNANTDQQFSQ